MKKLVLLTCAVSLSVAAMAQEKKVLFIGVDGVRSDALQLANTPTWDSLCQSGLFTYTSWHVGITVSGPSWSTMLTGVWHDKHGVTNNNYTGSDFNTFPYFVTRAKQYRPDLKAVQVTSWDPMSSAVYNDGWDEKIVVPTDDACEAAGIATLADPDLDVLFIHIDDCDAQGHGNGFSTTVASYMNQIDYVDGQLKRILNALKERANYANEDWLIVMTTDHGGIGTGHGGPTREEREIWWVAAGPSVPNAEIVIDLPNIFELFPDPANYRSAPMIVDIAVTALDHLLEQPIEDLITEWNLDGQSWLDYSTYIADEPENDLGMSVYPNPNNGQFEVRTTSGIYGSDLVWEILDITGKLQRKGQSTISSTELNIPFDLTDLKAGVYTLRMTAGGKSSVKRVAVR